MSYKWALALALHQLGTIRDMKAAVAEQDWLGAAKRLSLIRGIVLVNLLLGLITAVLGAPGRIL